MVSNSPLAADSASNRSTRAAGIAIGISSLAMILVMTHHPEVEADTTRAFVKGAAEIAGLTRLVHGAALGALALAVYGFWGLADRLGRYDEWSRAGWVAFLTGALGGGGAGMVNGFVAPALASRYAEASTQTLAALQPVLAFAGELAELLAQHAVFGWSIALVCWSVTLLRSRSAKILAILGFVAGAGPLIALTTGHLPMTVAGFGAFVAAQAVWSLAVAVQLIRGRL